MKNKIRKPALSAGSVLIWIIVWHILGSVANKGLMLKIPLPLDTLRAFADNLGNAYFWEAVGTSLLHIVLLVLDVLAVCWSMRQHRHQTNIKDRTSVQIRQNLNSIE